METSKGTAFFVFSFIWGRGHVIQLRLNKNSRFQCTYLKIPPYTHTCAGLLMFSFSPVHAQLFLRQSDYFRIKKCQRMYMRDVPFKMQPNYNSVRNLTGETGIRKRTSYMFLQCCTPYHTLKNAQRWPYLQINAS
jgi:hypothetical protein